MQKRQFLAYGSATAALFALGACSTTTQPAPGRQSDPAERRRAIDAKSDEALTNLYRQAAGSQEMVARARGVLIFPSILSAGFVVGGSYGEGVLRRGGRSVGYYSTAAGSVGLLAGAQSKAVYVLFLTQESLDKFEASKGWTAGVDASVVAINVGANASVDTASIKQPVVSYVLTGGGLMANLSFDGTKFTRLDI